MKFFFLITLLFLSFVSFSQIKLRGRVLSITQYLVVEDGSNKPLSKTYPTESFFHLSDKKFFINGSVQTPIYKLTDKDTTTIGGNMVISYISEVGNNYYLIGAKEISGERDVISVAVFNYSDVSKFTEYILKISPKSKL